MKIISNIFFLTALLPFTACCMEDELLHQNSLDTTEISAFKKAFKMAKNKKAFKSTLKSALDRQDIDLLKNLKNNPLLAEFNQQKIKNIIAKKIAHLFYEENYGLSLPMLIKNLNPFKKKLDAVLSAVDYDKETINAIHEHIIDAIKSASKDPVKKVVNLQHTPSLITVLRLLVSDNILFLLEKKPEYIPRIFNRIIQNDLPENVPAIVPTGDNSQLLQFYITDVKRQLLAQVEAGIIQPHEIFKFKSLTTGHTETIYKQGAFSPQEIDNITAKAPSAPKTKQLKTLADICKLKLKPQIEQQILESNIKQSQCLLNQLAMTYCINDWLREWDANTEPKNIFSRKMIFDTEQILFKLLLEDATKNGKVKRLNELADDPILETFSTEHQNIIKSRIQKYLRTKKIAKCFLKQHVKPRLNNSEPLDHDFLDKTYLEKNGYIDPTLFSHRFKRLLSPSNLEELITEKDNETNDTIFQNSKTPAATKKAQLALEIFATKPLINNQNSHNDMVTYVNNSNEFRFKHTNRLNHLYIEPGMAIKVFNN